MILIIDNYDSFTYNLVQLIAERENSCHVIKNDKTSLAGIMALNPEKIVLSPGPGRPREAGISVAVVREFAGKIPILGVCLGHQCIGVAYGAGIRTAYRLLHGKTSPVWHDGSKLFEHIPNPVTAARYHSLVLDRVPDEFNLAAWDEKNDIMAIRHQDFPVFGVQFHPESFLMPEGKYIIHNFLQCA